MGNTFAFGEGFVFNAKGLSVLTGISVYGGDNLLANTEGGLIVTSAVETHKEWSSLHERSDLKRIPYLDIDISMVPLPRKLKVSKSQETHQTHKLSEFNVGANAEINSEAGGGIYFIGTNVSFNEGKSSLNGEDIKFLDVADTIQKNETSFEYRAEISESFVWSAIGGAGVGIIGKNYVPIDFTASVGIVSGVVLSTLVKSIIDTENGEGMKLLNLKGNFNQKSSFQKTYKGTKVKVSDLNLNSKNDIEIAGVDFEATGSLNVKAQNGY